MQPGNRCHVNGHYTLKKANPLRPRLIFNIQICDPCKVALQPFSCHCVIGSGGCSSVRESGARTRRCAVLVLHDDRVVGVARPLAPLGNSSLTAFLVDRRAILVAAPARSAATARDRALLAAFGALAVLFCLRLALAATLPLSFDEAYYWLWSKHFALGYYEHPAAIALVIRAGTSLFGNTEWGVRAIPVLLFNSRELGSVAKRCEPRVGRTCGRPRLRAFQLNAHDCSRKHGGYARFVADPCGSSPVVDDGQAPDHCGRSLVAGDGRCRRPRDRGKIYRIFPVLQSAALAVRQQPCAPMVAHSLALRRRPDRVAVFRPDILFWNATHGFASFGFQFGRISSERSSHFFEFLGSQIALGSPFILVLAGFGLARNPLNAARSRDLSFPAAIVWPALIYFAFHSLHDRVQGNWPCFVYPALALLAAQSLPNDLFRVQEEVLGLARKLAFPTAALILAVIHAQAFFGMLPIGKHDPIARMMGVGFAPVAETVADDAARLHARAIVTTNYSATSWLAFYSRASLPVVQIADEERFLSSPRANAATLAGTLLYVTTNPGAELHDVISRFSQVRFVAKLARARNGQTID